MDSYLFGKFENKCGKRIIPSVPSQIYLCSLSSLNLYVYIIIIFLVSTTPFLHPILFVSLAYITIGIITLRLGLLTLLKFCGLYA
jgi:hypothetical protein